MAVAILHDHDTGLQAGGLALAYQGATPVLLGGYSAEIAAGAVLAACGPLLFRDARAAASASGTRSRSKLKLRMPKRRGRARSRPARAAG